MARKRAGQMDFRETTHDFISNSNSPLAAMFTDASKEMMKQQLPDQPDMWKKLTPNYNLGCKRVIISDDYFPALGQDHVALETREIHSVDGRSVKVAGGNGEPANLDDFDLIVCATGFKTVDFMHPIKLLGKGGRHIDEVWKDGAKALYGMTVEDMPNFGMLYGPNTNLGHNSIILMVEAQSRYINALIKPVLEAREQDRALSLTPKHSKIEAFNEEIQAELRASTFNDPNCNSWYKNDAGLITNNWSRTGKSNSFFDTRGLSSHLTVVVDYQHLVENVNFSDFDASGSGKNLVDEKKSVNVGRVKEESSVSDSTLMVMGAVSTAALVGGWLLRNSKHLPGIRLR